LPLWGVIHKTAGGDVTMMSVPYLLFDMEEKNLFVYFIFWRNLSGIFLWAS